MSVPLPSGLLLKTDCITIACLPPVEPTDGRGAGGEGRERAPEMADRAGPIRAGSVAAPRECRARPAWSRGHSSHDRSRDMPADTGAARPVLWRGSVDPHRSGFLQ